MRTSRVGLTAGIYHLASHAMFKAALFLGAGSVIHSVHTIYTFNMGGLKKYMKWTYILMGLATLSLSGVPPFSGFWSKDAVFLAAMQAGTPLAYVLLSVGVVSAAMTFAYSIRYISLTFRGDASEFIQDLEHHGHAPHESPNVMIWPIAILVGLFIITGVLGLAGVFYPSLNPEVFIEKQLHHMVEAMLPHEIAENLHVPHISATTKWIGAGLSALALSVGGFLGYNFYWAKNWDSWTWVQKSSTRKSIHNFLWNRWYMNAFFYRVFVDGTLGLTHALYNGFEAKVLIPLSDVVASTTQSASDVMYEVVEEGAIFGLINTSLPAAVISIYHKAKKSQTGLLSMNILYIVIMLLAIVFGMLLNGGT